VFNGTITTYVHKHSGMPSGKINKVVQWRVTFLSLRSELRRCAC